MKIILPILFILLYFSMLAAGDLDLYMPLDIQQLYKNGTRSIDGNPGPKYWQNSSDYKISVKIHPESGIVEGSEQIIYYNQSPDSLSNIVIRIYQDLFRRGYARDNPVDPEDLHDGVKITLLIINGEVFNTDFTEKNAQRTGTNLIIKPRQKIYSGSKTNISVNWSFKIPAKTKIRMGQYDSTSYLVAYWYPQISVYDDVDGWDRYNYTGIQEFYNDFNNYNVEISAPENFIVWATGVLQNPSEVLNKKYLNRYLNAQQSDSIVHIIEQSDLDTGNITKSGGWLTWRFKAENVPDFVFSTSDHYLWDMSGLVVDDKTWRRVVIGAAYNPESSDFFEVARIARKAIDYYSRKLPGVPFPYPEMTVFNGAGGMEFPMMVNDGSTESMPSTISLTSHEIAHTYFPFYMGINEKKYAWMDEGWAVMLPFDFVSSMTNKLDRRAVVTTQYNFIAGKELDIPEIVPSIVYGSNTYRPSYRGASYTRSSMAYNQLRQLLGDELFKKALHGYMERWHGKHPIPYDFFFSFDDITGDNLSWFWKPWLFEQGYPDLSIAGINKFNSSAEVVIESLGNIPVPVYLKTIYNDNSENVIQKSARIWSDGKKEIKIELKNAKNIVRLELGSPYIPDTDLKNNTWIMQ
jgi:hypothetical protein